jgi:hypothetical protein
MRFPDGEERIITGDFRSCEFVLDASEIIDDESGLSAIERDDEHDNVNDDGDKDEEDVDDSTELGYEDAAERDDDEDDAVVAVGNAGKNGVANGDKSCENGSRRHTSGDEGGDSTPKSRPTRTKTKTVWLLVAKRH